MWTLFTGYILSKIFENQTVKLFKNKFSNKQLSLIGIILGWLFQEHQRKENSLVTSGKRFMLEREYRNQFLTQILKIFSNIIFYPFIITNFELITLLFVFSVILLNIIIKQLPLINYYLTQTFNVNYKKLNQSDNNNLNFFITNLLYKFLKYCDFKNLLILTSIFIFFNNGFLKLYFWFDIFCLFQPIFIIIFFCFNLFCFFLLCYLLYIYVLNNFSKNLALLMNIFTKKIVIYFSVLIAFLELIIFELNNQNLTTENFFKEILFKIILFFC